LNHLAERDNEEKSLRAQKEELQQQNEHLRSPARSQCLNLDGRLSRLEGGVPAAPADDAGDPVSAVPSTPVPTDTPPRVHGDAGLLAGNADERGGYDTALHAREGGDAVPPARPI